MPTSDDSALQIARELGLSPDLVRETAREADEQGRAPLDLLVEKGHVRPEQIETSETVVRSGPGDGDATAPTRVPEEGDDGSGPGAATRVTPPPGGAPPAGEGSGDGPLPPRLGQVRVVEKLGQGGMGQVYLGHDEALDRPVVIKVLAPHLQESDEFRGRFQREARAAARLDHPNIVTIYGVGETGRYTYIEMQYVEGESLDDRLKRKGPLPVDEAARVVMEAAEGVAEAHRHEIVHRDLKPANLVVTERGDVKVLDFGLARVDDGQGLSRTGEVMGTLQYMPPEQAEGEPVDERADVYSLGATLYALLAGEPPFSGPSTASVLKAILLDTPPPIAEARPDLAEPLCAFIERSLAKEPADRPATMGAFRRGLQEALEAAGEEVESSIRAPSGAHSPAVGAAGTAEEDHGCEVSVQVDEDGCEVSASARRSGGWGRRVLVGLVLLAAAAAGVWWTVLREEPGPDGPEVATGEADDDADRSDAPEDSASGEKPDVSGGSDAAGGSDASGGSGGLVDRLGDLGADLGAGGNELAELRRRLGGDREAIADSIRDDIADGDLADAREDIREAAELGILGDERTPLEDALAEAESTRAERERERVVSAIRDDIADGDLDDARERLREARDDGLVDGSRADDLEREIRSAEERSSRQHVNRLLTEARLDLSAGDVDEADEKVREAIACGASPEQVEELVDGIAEARAATASPDGPDAEVREAAGPPPPRAPRKEGGG